VTGEGYLLDTNVVSEWVKPRPNTHVVAWLEQVDEDRVCLSTATIAEVRRGIELLPQGRRREQLTLWLAGDLTARFEGRLLPIDVRVAEAWGGLMAQSQRSGLQLGVMDGFIAATAKTHGLILVTRNIRHFTSIGITLFDPWQPRA
jgi:predicted nucleic acid-binding protein